MRTRQHLLPARLREPLLAVEAGAERLARLDPRPRTYHPGLDAQFSLLTMGQVFFVGVR